MTATRTTESWCDYLAARCKAEGVELWLKPAELFGWVVNGVSEDDDEDDVFEALKESLSNEE